MKTLLFITLLVLVLMFCKSQAATVVRVVVAWNYADWTNIIGFRAYYGFGSGNYTASQDAPYTSSASTNYLMKISLPWDGQSPIYLRVVAVGTNGLESVKPGEIQIQ